MIGTKWLRAKLGGEADPSTNPLRSDLARNSEQILAHRVNELLKGKNKHFARSHAEKFVEQAIRIAREKIQSAELAKRAAEAELTRHRWKATAAEQRANEAEATARRLDDELRALRMRRARLMRTAA